MCKHPARIIIGVFFWIAVGCSTKSSNSTNENSNSPTYPGPAETPYCASAVSYTGSTVTITGLAQYLRREPWGNASTGGLGGALTTSTHPATLHAVRRAEVRILAANGAVVQCAETDNNGAFSFTLPTSSASFSVSVNSRALNTHLKASVLNRPVNNQFYSMTATFTPDTSKALATMTATADGAILGAAFNILDQLLYANEFLRLKAGSCSVFATCTDFTVAPKVTAYWSIGFNPNSFFGGSSGLSFYLPDYYRLFILGGINGDVNSSDTDHYDNSVIVHEYGHFLENTMFHSDSPGGSHNGNGVIDPRLAWSEGWGNFFQAAVQNYIAGIEATPSSTYVHRYIDSIGNDDGATDLAFFVDLETPDGHDNVNMAGEGNFREFSVTRLLWDVIDPVDPSETLDTGSDDISDRFIEIWASLTKGTNGFKSSNLVFRNIGLLHLIQRNLFAHESAAGATDWGNVRALNRQIGNESSYAQTVSGGACGSPYAYSFPKDASYVPTYKSDDGQLGSSDLFRNNNFFHLRITSRASYTIRLDYLDADGTGAEKDLDLYLYNSSAQLATSTDMIQFSHESPDGNKATAESETVTATLAPGDYLIQVNVYTGGLAVAGQVNYSLKLNGSTLCPADLVPP